MTGEWPHAGMDQPVSGQRRRAPELFAAFVALPAFGHTDYLLMRCGWRIDSGGSSSSSDLVKRRWWHRTEMADSVKIIPVNADHTTGKTTESAQEAAVSG